MTLDEFKAEVLSVLPALASWDFSDRWGDSHHVILNARHPSKTAWVFRTDDEHGVYWRIETVELPGSMCPALIDAVAHFRKRHADLISSLADLSVTP
jgi:hypothetical protein